MCFSKPDKDKSAEQRQARVTQGTKQVNDVFAQYDDPFFAQRASDYQGWALPQVDTQYDQAKKDLTFALARQYGSTNTSVAAEKQADLAKQYGLAKAAQVDQGLAAATQARANVEDSRTRVLQQLNATADPAAAAQTAMNQNALLTHTDPFTPLGELFANATEGLAASSYPYGVFNQPTTPYSTAPGTGGASRKASYTVT